MKDTTVDRTASGVLRSFLPCTMHRRLVPAVLYRTYINSTAAWTLTTIHPVQSVLKMEQPDKQNNVDNNNNNNNNNGGVLTNPGSTVPTN